ncbi:hypothetical protein GCM10027347_58050 [Larkinella harenae]
MYFGFTATVTKDAINQIYADLWERGKNLPEVANIRSYLITALRRKLIKEFSRGERYTELTDLEVDIEPSYEEIIVQGQEQEDLRNRLRQAIGQLTPRQRELIEMRFFRNKRNEEIAEETGMNINTVYNTLSSALKVLRQTLTIGSKEKIGIIHIWWLIFLLFGL